MLSIITQNLRAQFYEVSFRKGVSVYITSKIIYVFFRNSPLSYYTLEHELPAYLSDFLENLHCSSMEKPLGYSWSVERKSSANQKTDSSALLSERVEAILAGAGVLCQTTFLSLRCL